MGDLLRAEELQQQRSMRVMQNITRQVEIQADHQLYMAEKIAARDEKLAVFEAEQQEMHRQRMTEAAIREQQRKECAEAAALHEQQMREHAHRKFMAVENRVDELVVRREEEARRNREHTAQVAARRDAAYQSSVQLAETRRATFSARQVAAERIAREREEVRSLERNIQVERAFLKQEARNASKERAEADVAERVALHLRKSQAKEAALESWQRSASATRRLKAQEARERAEYVAMQAKLAAEADAAKRAQYQAVAATKAARVDALLAEREALADRMLRLRNSIMQQEQAMRGALEALRHGSPARAGAAGPLLAAALVADAEARGPAHGATGRCTTALTVPSHATATMRTSRIGGGAGRSVSMRRPRPWSAMAVPAFRKQQPTYAPVGGARPASTGPSRAAVAPGWEAQAAMQLQGYTTLGHVAPGLVGRREDELRGVLREEIDKETERQAILSGTPDSTEAMRLAVIFAAEREAAKQRILAQSVAMHEAACAHQAAQLSPQLVAPGQTGQPATTTFLTPAPAPPPAGPAQGLALPLGTEPLVAVWPGLGGGRPGVVTDAGFHQVYTRRAVELPDYKFMPSPMEHRTLPHHHMVKVVPVA